MALVLTRRVDETICIGDDITITVLGINRSQVRVAVAAPKDMPVHRLEIAEKIRAENGGKLDIGRRDRARA